MKKEVNLTLYTQSAYAKKTGLTRQRINQLVKSDELSTLKINGSILIKSGNGETSKK